MIILAASALTLILQAPIDRPEGYPAQRDLCIKYLHKIVDKRKVKKQKGLQLRCNFYGSKEELPSPVLIRMPELEIPKVKIDL